MFINNTKRQIRYLNNKIADRYEELVYSDPTDPTSITNRYKIVFITLELKPGINVLELGAGTGVFTIPLAIMEPDACIFALEIAEIMLNKLYRKLNYRYLNNVYLINADFDYLPFLSNKFDRVFYSYSIQDSRTPIATVKDAIRVLNPRGKLVVLGSGSGYKRIGNKSLDSIIRELYPPHAHYYDKEEIEFFMIKSNLTNVKSSIVYMDSWLIDEERVTVPLYVVSGTKL